MPYILGICMWKEPWETTCGMVRPSRTTTSVSVRLFPYPFPESTDRGWPPWKTRAVNLVWQAESPFNTNCRYRQFELLISPIVIADINCRYQQFALGISVMNMICSYRQIELLMSTIGIVAIAHLWYRQLKLLMISTMYIHYWYRQLELLLQIVDIDNWNCWYQ